MPSTSSITPIPRQGEIWRVNFDPTLGAEIRKTRPALVVSADDVGRLPLCIVVPITNWDTAYANFPWFVQLLPDATNGLSKSSGVDAFQVKSVARVRIQTQLGKVTARQFTQVIRAIALCLEPGDDLTE